MAPDASRFQSLAKQNEVMTAANPVTAEPVLILGGGLMGLAIAHQLARRGMSVIVLSRRRSEAAGFVAAGMLAPHAEGLSGDLLALGQRSLDMVPSWVAQIEADSGLTCGLRTTGIVVPFRSAEERDRYPTAAFGQTLTAGQLHHELPGLASHWTAGLLFGQDGQIDNRRQLMRALESACVDRGVHFQEGVEVLDIVQNNNTLEAVTARNSEGQLLTMSCSTAVLCSGAWSAQLVPELPVFPVKGQMLSLQSPKGALRRVIFGPGTYLVPREDGLVVVGATSEREAQFRGGLTPQGQTTLGAGIASLLPEASQWPPMERWWGFRPCTPDEGPLLGFSAIDGLLLACGHYRNGVLLAAITANLLSNLIADTNESSDLDGEILQQFRWDRFQRRETKRQLTTLHASPRSQTQPCSVKP